MNHLPHTILYRSGIKLCLVRFLSFLLLSVLLQSCLKEENDYAQLTIGTVRLIGDRYYYFDLDNGCTMHPGDTTAVRGYVPVDGQRVFIHFNLMNQDQPDYDYNATIYQIENILTKDVYIMPAEKADSIGDDYINITNLWIAQDYLNVQYLFYYDRTSEVKHMLNLVVNTAADSLWQEADSDYLPLEFRHNAFDERGNDRGVGLVSFRLASIDSLMTGKQGLSIRTNTLRDGICHHTVDFK